MLPLNSRHSIDHSCKHCFRSSGLLRFIWSICVSIEFLVLKRVNLDPTLAGLTRFSFPRNHPDSMTFVEWVMHRPQILSWVFYVSSFQSFGFHLQNCIPCCFSRSETFKPASLQRKGFESIRHAQEKKSSRLKPIYSSTTSNSFIQDVVILRKIWQSESWERLNSTLGIRYR